MKEVYVTMNSQPNSFRQTSPLKKNIQVWIFLHKYAGGDFFIRYLWDPPLETNILVPCQVAALLHCKHRRSTSGQGAIQRMLCTFSMNAKPSLIGCGGEHDATTPPLTFFPASTSRGIPHVWYMHSYIGPSKNIIFQRAAKNGISV